MLHSSKMEDLLDDLLRLKKGDGFTEGSLRNAMTFREVAGGSAGDFPTLRGVLLSAITSLPSERDMYVLLAAYALSYDYRNIRPLRERRAKFAQAAGVSPDTVGDWERAAAGELALLLLERRYARSPLPDGVPVLHGEALFDSVRIATVIQDRCWRESREEYAMVPLVDGVRQFQYVSDVPVVLTPPADCTLSTETVANGWKHVLAFPEPLVRGKIRELAYRVVPDGVEQKDLLLAEDSRPLVFPAISAEMEVVFLGELPEVAWSFARLSLVERPGRPAEDSILDFHGGSSVHVRWSELDAGQFYGIAWRWRE